MSPLFLVAGWKLFAIINF